MSWASIRQKQTGTLLGGNMSGYNNVQSDAFIVSCPTLAQKLRWAIAVPQASVECNTKIQINENYRTVYISERDVGFLPTAI
jgi:hypothetical protein